ncbi:MAG: methyltransferase domain-containing protein [Anaerolineales bacterium]|nr:methyltransferase domain-containing protein [Anaerolineales bacterium]
MNLITQRFMRIFFKLLYHPFAFTYDLIAAAVSFGHWKDWVMTVLPFIEGKRILELGHGPGHLQRALLNLKIDSVAIDESAQMGTLTKRRLGSINKLTRGLAQHLPFRNNSFDTVVATFPTNYIFRVDTLSEIRRCLSDGGRLIVLPAAFPNSRFLKWLYKVTGESPAQLDESIKSKFKQPFINAGFETETQIIEVKSSNLLIVIAHKIGKEEI